MPDATASLAADSWPLVVLWASVAAFTMALVLAAVIVLDATNDRGDQ